jgi:hypothetical protein
VAAVSRYPLGGEAAEYTVVIVFELSGSFVGTIEQAEGLLRTAWTAASSRKDMADSTHRTRTGRGIRVIDGGQD